MSNPYTSVGYTDLRKYAAETYRYLALEDDTGTEITRFFIPDGEPATQTITGTRQIAGTNRVVADGAGSRVTNTPDPSTNPLTYTVEIEGSDSDIPNPVTVASTALYDADDSTQPIGTESMKAADVEADNDTLTISHDQELPPQ